MIYKKCIECNVSKPVSEYAIRNLEKQTYHNRCKPCTNIYAKKWRDTNKISIKQKQTDWYITKGKNWKKEYTKTNKDKINKHSRNRYNSDKQYRIKRILRTRFYKMANKKYKKSSMLNYLGIDINTFLNWIEYNFDDTMTWNNQGKTWDIDHVMPCDHYDLTIEENITYCFNWRNLRPMIKKENGEKSNKINMIYVIETMLKSIDFESLYIDNTTTI